MIPLITGQALSGSSDSDIDIRMEAVDQEDDAGLALPREDDALAAAAAQQDASQLAHCISEWLSGFGATKPFTQRSADELLMAMRAACSADSPACVALLLHTTSTVMRSADCVLKALVMSASAGSARALTTVLSSPQMLLHMRWRGPKAIPMLAEALADALRCALASHADACFNGLLQHAERPGAPLALARAALAPHMRAVFCEAARRGARGALQALLVSLPEHCDLLDCSALGAAYAAGQSGMLQDIQLLLSLRVQAMGQEPLGSAAGAAACPGAGQLQHQSSGNSSVPDIRVLIDSGSCCASPGSVSCASHGVAAPPHKHPRAAPAPRSSFSSIPSSSDCCSSGASSQAGSDYGAATDTDMGDASRSRPRRTAQGSSGRPAPSVQGRDGSPVHPYMQQPPSGSASSPPTGTGARPPLASVNSAAAASPAARLRAALRQAVGADNVARAAQLLTELVDATEGMAAAASAAGPGEVQPLDAFIVELISAAAGAGACDCAHLLMTAIGGNDDTELKSRACRALCLSAASCGRAALLRVCVAHHAWVAGALAAEGGRLGLECFRAAVLRSHPHTAVWVCRMMPGQQGQVQGALEGLLATPSWQLQRELAALDCAGAARCGGGAKGMHAGAVLDVKTLVGAFARAWAASEGMAA